MRRIFAVKGRMASKTNSARLAILVASILVAGALIAGFFGRAHPALDSFSHFRAHLAVLLGLVALGLLALRLRLNALVAGLLALGAFSTTMSGSWLPFGAAQAALPANGKSYTLLQANLRWNHPDPDRVLSFIKQLGPDIVTLDEISPMWAANLATIKPDYPYQVICDSRHFGSVILSRWPIAEQSQRCIDRGALAIAAINLDGHSIDVASVHLNWPWPRKQPQQIGRLENTFQSLGDTAILAGDLNAATWSAATRRVADAGKLTVVPGIGATWLAYGIPRSMRWAGLPIDHIMVKGAIQPIRASVLEDVGSDHWPVVLEFALKPIGKGAAN